MFVRPSKRDRDRPRTIQRRRTSGKIRSIVVHQLRLGDRGWAGWGRILAHETFMLSAGLSINARDGQGPARKGWQGVLQCFLVLRFAGGVKRGPFKLLSRTGRPAPRARPHRDKLAGEAASAVGLTASGALGSPAASAWHAQEPRRSAQKHRLQKLPVKSRRPLRVSGRAWTTAIHRHGRLPKPSPDR